MGSNEENRLPNGDIRMHKDVDWSRYGLHEPEPQRNTRKDNEGYNTLDPEMYQAGTNELFAQEYVSSHETILIPHYILYSKCHSCFSIFFLEFRSLVEIELFYFSTCAIWYLGWCFYILSYQYIWSDCIFEIRLDSWSSRCFERSINNFMYR